MLSDIGSWASIISLVIGLIGGFSVCKVTTQKNFNFSFFQRDNNQQNTKS